MWCLRSRKHDDLHCRNDGADFFSALTDTPRAKHGTQRKFNVCKTHGPR